MKRFRFNHAIIIILISLSVIFFFLQQIIFHDLHESGFLLFQDMIFLPVHTLLVTFILDRILYAREKRKRLDQLNIVIGAFFTEIGSKTLSLLTRYISNPEHLQPLLTMNNDWIDKDFDAAAKTIRSQTFQAQCGNDGLEALKAELPKGKAFLIAQFSNPNILEHDTFTDMLWALYHLIDELENRENVCDLPGTDVNHLSGDISRAYGLLVTQWVMYMKHLKTSYPYLWSLAIRKNPLADHSSVVIH